MAQVLWQMLYVWIGFVGVGTLGILVANAELPRHLKREAAQAFRSELRVETAEGLRENFAVWCSGRVWAIACSGMLMGFGLACIVFALVGKFV